ncbi:MAG: hypothetical protein IJ783_03140, partial [Kiritimatiellae bacterium]|nr:hypothetical protein [Kiritimatiellia bacterium]
HWLGEIFLEARDRVPGFSPALCEELGVKWKEPPAPVDREKIETLLSGLAKVEKWKDPVKRGKRTFDDSEFVASVSAQFGAKGSLSPAQISVLDRMFLRYKDQIPGAEETIGKYGLEARPRTAARRRFQRKTPA